jgi:hypothetical protein
MIGTIIVCTLLAALITAAGTVPERHRETALRTLCGALVLAAVASVLLTFSASGWIYG